jgi:protein TonB
MGQQNRLGQGCVERRLPLAGTMPVNMRPLTLSASALLHTALLAVCLSMPPSALAPERPIVVVELVRSAEETPAEQPPPAPRIDPPSEQQPSAPQSDPALERSTENTSPAEPVRAEPLRQIVANERHLAAAAPRPWRPHRTPPQRTVAPSVPGPVAAVPEVPDSSGVAPVAQAVTAPHPPADYVGLIQARLLAVKRYPAEARTRRQEGIALVRFVLAADGEVMSAQISCSSGFASLDAEGLAMIARAAPFPPLPETMSAAPLALAVPVAFSLRSR